MAAFWPWAMPQMRDVGPEEASPPAKTPSREVRSDSSTSMVPRFVSRMPSASQKIDVSSFGPMAAITWRHGTTNSLPSTGLTERRPEA